MINFDQNQNDDLQVVDGNFNVSSGSNDPSAFFNMNPSDFQYNNNQQNYGNDHYSYSPHLNGGFAPNNFFGYHSQNDQIVTPPPPANSQGPQCNGNCGACIWSFLCKKATANFSSIGGSAPKLA